MKKNNVLGVALTLLLVLAGLICVGISLTASQNTALATVVKLAVYVVIITYTLFDFLIPHTNVFKYIMLFFGIGLAATVNELAGFAVQDVQYYHISIPLTMIAMVLIGYMSGRLNKLGKNFVLKSLILALLVAAFVLNVLSIGDLPQLMIARYASDSFTWLALCAAYLTRFKAHKEAGEAADAAADTTSADTTAEEKPAE